jgi:hypothetical protein
MAAKKTNKPKPPPTPSTELVVVENATHWVHEPSKPPHLVIDAAGLDIIRQMIAKGHDRPSVAAALKMSKSTLSECIKRQPEVEAALEQGRSALHSVIFSALLEQGLKGYAPALMFLAKCRLGWRETDTPETQTNVLINLPGTQSMEDWQQNFKNYQLAKGQTK